MDEAIIYLAKQVGLTIHEAYRITVNAQRYMALKNLVAGILGVVVGIISWIISYRVLPKVDRTLDSIGRVYIAFLLGVLFGLLAWTILDALIVVYLKMKIPEYFALKEMLEMVR